MAQAAAPKGFSPCGIVTLTTDFGTRDGYVGAMKGVLLARAPGLSVHDLAHAIEPQNVAHGAAVLRTACPWFPPGTVHLAVVDPGVGTERAGIVVQAGGHVFVGPDNGLLLPACDALGGVGEVRRIDQTGRLGAYLAETVSTTFHGRDVFAPTAAALAGGGLDLADVGPPHDPVRPAQSHPIEEASGASGVVTHVDHFGNAITNLAGARLRAGSAAAFEVDVAGRTLALVTTYGAVAQGEACAVIGSGGCLEIAVRGGNAATTLGIARGTLVRVRESRRS